MKLFWRPSRARLCVARWLVANRGTTPTDAPMCRPSAVASSCGERSSRAGFVSSWRRSAAMYRPRSPSTSKAWSKPSSVLPSSASARTKTRPSSRICVLSVVAHAVDVRAVVLREVRLLERGVELDERGADPRVERFDVPAHRLSGDRKHVTRRADEPPRLDFALAFHVDEARGLRDEVVADELQVDRVI